MKRAAQILVVFVALEHFLFLVLEMFLWTTPTGMNAFGLTADFAEKSAALAANQGLYNGFLGAGLIYGLLRKDAGRPTIYFFLICVIVAGLFGAVTAKPTILFVQAVPAALALTLLFLSNKKES